MARRIEVTGADGVHLVAWEFMDPSGRRGAPGPPDAPGPAGRPWSGSLSGGPSRDALSSAGSSSGASGGTTPAPESPAPAPPADPEPSLSNAPNAPNASNGPSTPAVLLLHGLMGRAAHWASAARLLAGRHRTVALDQRGHGDSGKPADGPFTREAYIADAEAVIERLGLAPVTLIGHSTGALTAWRLAALRPDLVGALVVCDMRASAPGAASQREWEEWCASWPLPFATLAEARAWFGEGDPWLERPSPARGAFYAETMAEGADGWRPVFSRRQMLASRASWAGDAHWEDLAQVPCPTLVVRGVDGELGRAEAQEMVRVLPRGQYAEVPDAGPLVHHERPDAWHAAVEPFLRALPAPGPLPADCEARPRG